MKFVLQLHIDGVDFENAEARAKIWLKEELFNATQKKQLAAVCQNMNPDVTLQQIFRASFDFYHESMNGMAEVPIEVWEVMDDPGEVKYTVWLCCADGAYVFKSQSDEMIGMMTQWGFQDPPEAGVSEDLVAAFPDAEEKYPDSLLAGYDFSYKK